MFFFSETPECRTYSNIRCCDKNSAPVHNSANLDDVEADTPLEQRLLVDQDLFREKNNNLKTYSRRGTPMSKSLHIHLERCDGDDYDVAVVPLQEISLDESTPRGNGRTRKSKIQEMSPSPKKRRVSVRNDENESSCLADLSKVAGWTHKKSTDANFSGQDLQSSPGKLTLEDNLPESTVLTIKGPKSPRKSPVKCILEPVAVNNEVQERRSTRSSSQLNLVTPDCAELTVTEPDGQQPEVACTPTITKSPRKENQADDESNKSVKESTPESSVFKTPIFTTSGKKRLRSSTISYADVSCSSLDITSEADFSSDDDTSWNDSLECLELPNQLLELTEQIEEDRQSMNVEEPSVDEHVSLVGQDLSVGADLTLDSTSGTSEDDEEGFEFKKGAPVLAKIGNWPHWPAFVVPFHGSYRTSNTNSLFILMDFNWLFLLQLKGPRHISMSYFVVKTMRGPGFLSPNCCPLCHSWTAW